MKDLILGYLVQFTEFRERRAKNKYIGCIIFKKYGIDLTPKMKDQMSDLVADIESANRAWRKILEENENLRGTDYGSKEDLEIIKQRELGYNV